MNRLCLNSEKEQTGSSMESSLVLVESMDRKTKQISPKRDRLDIILTILEIANQPIKKTHILYTAKINYYQLTRYLDLLLAMGVVEVTSDPFESYKTTEKGRLLINLFSQTQDRKQTITHSFVNNTLT